VDDQDLLVVELVGAVDGILVCGMEDYLVDRLLGKQVDG